MSLYDCGCGSHPAACGCGNGCDDYKCSDTCSGECKGNDKYKKCIVPTERLDVSYSQFGQAIVTDSGTHSFPPNTYYWTGNGETIMLIPVNDNDAVFQSTWHTMTINGVTPQSLMPATPPNGTSVTELMDRFGDTGTGTTFKEFNHIPTIDELDAWRDIGVDTTTHIAYYSDGFNIYSFDSGVISATNDEIDLEVNYPIAGDGTTPPVAINNLQKQINNLQGNVNALDDRVDNIELTGGGGTGEPIAIANEDDINGLNYTS